MAQKLDRPFESLYWAQLLWEHSMMYVSAFFLEVHTLNQFILQTSRPSAVPGGPGTRGPPLPRNQVGTSKAPMNMTSFAAAPSTAPGLLSFYVLVYSVTFYGYSLFYVIFFSSGARYVELSRLPTEMLRPAVLEQFLRPSIPLQVSSVKVVFSSQGK